MRNKKNGNYLKFTFDCDTDTYDLIVKKNNETGLQIYSGTDLPFKAGLNTINRITLENSYGVEGEMMYFDDIVCSFPITVDPLWNLSSGLKTSSSYNDNGTISSWLKNGTKSTGMWEAYPTLQFNSDPDIAGEKITWAYDTMPLLIKVNDTIHCYFAEMFEHSSEDMAHLVRKIYILFNHTPNSINYSWYRFIYIDPTISPSCIL